MPLDPVKLRRRPHIRLRVLPAPVHSPADPSVPLADITPDHPLVRNILAHLALQVRFDPQPAQQVRALRFDPLEEWRRYVELGDWPCGSLSCKSGPRNARRKR
jgi:hypothetical protein